MTVRRSKQSQRARSTSLPLARRIVFIIAGVDISQALDLDADGDADAVLLAYMPATGVHDVLTYRSGCVAIPTPTPLPLGGPVAWPLRLPH